MRISRFSSTTMLVSVSILILLIFNAVLILTINHFFKKEAIAEAQEKAGIILDKNLSLHDYFTNQLKPVIYDALETLEEGEDYFEPTWMSSTYAIKKLKEYFAKYNDFGYYYKDAAFNARSEENEADILELKYLTEINKDPNLGEQDGIVTINEIPYYYLLKKGETLRESCLRCHSTPGEAPRKLTEIYGNVKSFNRNMDEIISVVSIRIPLSQTYERANYYFWNTSILTTLLLIIFIVSYLLVQKRLVFNTIDVLRKQAVAIAQDNSKLGDTIEINSTKDLTELVSSFNSMSQKLFNYNRTLEEKVRLKTADLSSRVEEVSRLNEMKDKLFSIIAHDLKGPFNSILGYSELLANNMGDFEKEQAEKMASVINSSSKQTLGLLENLLIWARTQSGHTMFKPENISLQPVIQGIVGVLNSSASLKNISIHMQMDKKIMAFADKNMLQTVLRNLISNAIKFTNVGGRINIFAVSDQNQVEISVEDNGIGMNSKILKGLFRMESDIQTQGTANEKGSGLGLLICKEFVEKHGGKIEGDGEPGIGSIFTFTLPLKNKF